MNQNSHYGTKVRVCAVSPKSDIMVELSRRRKAAEAESDVHCIRNPEKSGTTHKFYSRSKLFVHTKN